MISTVEIAQIDLTWDAVCVNGALRAEEYKTLGT
jgi:hypothetical protein